MRESNSRRIVKNKDNDSLLPWGNDRFVVGYVDEVNGPGAAEIPDFIPTRHELLSRMTYLPPCLSAATTAGIKSGLLNHEQLSGNWPW